MNSKKAAAPIQNKEVRARYIIIEFLRGDGPAATLAEIKVW
jgi:hypothetical protein